MTEGPVPVMPELPPAFDTALATTVDALTAAANQLRMNEGQANTAAEQAKDGSEAEKALRDLASANKESAEQCDAALAQIADAAKPADLEQ